MWIAAEGRAFAMHGESMADSTVTCPACGKLYRLPDMLPRQPRIKLRCPACRVGFTIELAKQMERAPVQSPEEPSPERESAAATPADRVERPLSREERRRLERRAKRLARVIVQELLGGQTARRDKALSEGTLLLEFGEEVRRAWITYQEKAGEEIAQSTSFFRDALNEILADGKTLF
jgi:hypothetical protein